RQLRHRLGRRVDRVGRALLGEPEPAGPHLELVSRLEVGRAVDALSVDAHAVAAAVVGDLHTLCRHTQAGMATRDGLVVDPDLAPGVTPDAPEPGSQEDLVVPEL